MKNSIERADSVSSVASFFRVSEDEVLSRSLHLVKSVGDEKFITESDYTILRRFLFSLTSNLKPFNRYVLKRNLMAIHGNEKIVDKFISVSKSVVTEPITSNKFIWVDEVKTEFYDYLVNEIKKDTFTISNVALKSGVKPSVVYSVAYHYDLIKDADLEHLSTESYYTLLLFFNRFKMVKDTALVDRVSAVSSKSVVKIRLVGSFVERSVIDFVEASKRELVSRIDGDDFVEFDNVVAYLEAHGGRVSRGATRFMELAVPYGEQFIFDVDGRRYFDKAFLDRVLALRESKNGMSAFEALVIESGHFSLEEFSRHLSHYSLVSVLSKLEAEGILGKNVKRHLSVNMESESKVAGLRLFEPESVERILVQHVYGLSVDKVYKNRVSVGYLIEFLNQSDASFVPPAFLVRSGGSYELSPDAFNYVEFVSYSVSMAHIGAMSADLYTAYMEWADDKFRDKVNRIKSVIKEVMEDGKFRDKVNRIKSVIKEVMEDGNE